MIEISIFIKGEIKISFITKCVATDAATLKEGDCYTLTAYQYSWNPLYSRCALFGTVVQNTNNSNSTSTATTTDSANKLVWTFVF